MGCLNETRQPAMLSRELNANLRCSLVAAMQTASTDSTVQYQSVIFLAVEVWAFEQEDLPEQSFIYLVAAAWQQLRLRFVGSSMRSLLHQAG